MADINNLNPAVPKPLPNIAQEAADALKGEEHDPVYPNVFPINLPGGQFYIDSTPDKESVWLRHKSGSFVHLEANGDIYIHSPKDVKVSAERNFVIKVGQGNKEKAIVHVTGDAHLKVEGDLITEVGGSKKETISGDYNLVVKGTFSSDANTRNTKTDGTHTEIAHEQVNNLTFVKNNIGIPDKDGVGGEIRNIVFGNIVTEMPDPRTAFCIHSLGTINFSAGVDMIQFVGGAYVGLTTGAYTQTVGGALNMNVTGAALINAGGAMTLSAGLIMKLTGAQIFLN